jgi:hypothetical protein
VKTQTQVHAVDEQAPLADTGVGGAVGKHFERGHLGLEFGMRRGDDLGERRAWSSMTGCTNSSSCSAWPTRSPTRLRHRPATAATGVAVARIHLAGEEGDREELVADAFVDVAVQIESYCLERCGFDGQLREGGA